MKLAGKKIAILVDELYNEVEFWIPYYRMKEEGARVSVVCREETHKSKVGLLSAKRDIKPKDARGDDFDGLIVPGGYAPDMLRRDEDVLRFVREMDGLKKPIASICHAAWVLISARVVEGRTMTCYVSIKDDLINAGARYVDQEIVVDGNMISSRRPDDLPAFCRAIIAAL